MKEPTEHHMRHPVINWNVLMCHKRRAQESEDPSRDIIQSSLVNLQEVTLANLPKKVTMQRNIRRYRNVNVVGVEHIVPPELQRTLNGELFLRHEVDFLLFAVDKDLKYLASCRVWFADGTFRVSPA